MDGRKDNAFKQAQKKQKLLEQIYLYNAELDALAKYFAKTKFELPLNDDLSFSPSSSKIYGSMDVRWHEVYLKLNTALHEVKKLLNNETEKNAKEKANFFNAIYAATHLSLIVAGVDSCNVLTEEVKTLSVNDCCDKYKSSTCKALTPAQCVEVCEEFDAKIKSLQGSGEKDKVKLTEQQQKDLIEKLVVDKLHLSSNDLFNARKALMTSIASTYKPSIFVKLHAWFFNVKSWILQGKENGSNTHAAQIERNSQTSDQCLKIYVCETQGYLVKVGKTVEEKKQVASRCKNYDAIPDHKKGVVPRNNA